jgi:hypothetical protein
MKNVHFVEKMGLRAETKAILPPVSSYMLDPAASVAQENKVYITGKLTRKNSKKGQEME